MKKRSARLGGTHNLFQQMQWPYELVRYATLAASSHNTQCWQFQLEDQLILILPDLERRCPAVDPDDHHLYASLGCAAENLLQAAQTYGLQGTVDTNLCLGL